MQKTGWGAWEPLSEFRQTKEGLGPSDQVRRALLPHLIFFPSFDASPRGTAELNWRNEKSFTYSFSSFFLLVTLSPELFLKKKKKVCRGFANNHEVWRRFVNHLFSCSVMSNSLRPHGLQHTWLPCPVSRNLLKLIESVMPSSHLFLCCLPLAFSIFQHQGLFPVSQLFISGGQRIAASVFVLPMNIQGWFLLGLTGLISLQSKGLWRVFSSTTVWKHQFFGPHPS